MQAAALVKFPYGNFSGYLSGSGLEAKAVVYPCKRPFRRSHPKSASLGGSASGRRGGWYRKLPPGADLRATRSCTVTDEQTFEPESRAAFDELRASLIELYSCVGADPGRPQFVARQLGLNKTLTWNIARVIKSGDPIAMLPSVPGTAALKVLLEAAERAGGSPKAIARVQHASRALEHAVEVHFGDRSTLELVVDGMGGGRSNRLELSRKLAFRGNSGLWGIQAKTRLHTVFIAPNADDPDRLDIANIRAFVGFRRLRPEVRWPIFQIRSWGDAGEPLTAERWKSLDDNEGLPLMERFSTVEPSQIEEVRVGRGLNYVLAPGPIGNSGSIDCFQGDYERSAVGKYRTEADETGEFGATISAPTETLIFDLIVHESLDFVLKPSVRAVGGIFAERQEEQSAFDLLPIPIPDTIEMLPGQPPVVATPRVPRYSEIVGAVEERMKWDLSTFRACRLELNYPPLGSTVLLRFQLPSAP